MRDPLTSIITMFQMLFGNFDYDSMNASNRVLAPAWFLFFFIFLGLILMNIFIAVISDSYISIEKVNEFAWEININRLLIENLVANGITTSIDQVANFIATLKRRFFPPKVPKQERTFSQSSEIPFDEMEMGSLISKDYTVMYNDDVVDSGGNFIKALAGLGGEEESIIVYNDSEIDDKSLELANQREEGGDDETTEKIDKLMEDVAELKELVKKLAEDKSKHHHEK